LEARKWGTCEQVFIDRAVERLQAAQPVRAAPGRLEPHECRAMARIGIRPRVELRLVGGREVRRLAADEPRGSLRFEIGWRVHSCANRIRSLSSKEGRLPKLRTSGAACAHRRAAWMRCASTACSGIPNRMAISLPEYPYTLRSVTTCRHSTGRLRTNSATRASSGAFTKGFCCASLMDLTAARGETVMYARHSLGSCSANCALTVARGCARKEAARRA